MNHKDIQHADIQWNEEGQPISSEYDDVYFSKTSGVDEANYVFLEMNQLPHRWGSLEKTSTDIFTIGETGFGTGLNFLSAWQLWDQTAPPSSQLHFVSVEKYPLTKADLSKALSLWPPLQKYAKQLIEQYPVTFFGNHRLSFDGGGVSLTLIINDAIDGFHSLLDTTHPAFSHYSGLKIDAWFLDGFAPAKNPDMWSDQLFEAIKTLSRANTTLATFTAAGIVRRGLSAAGFDIEKKPGFGHKREMIIGQMLETPSYAAPPTKVSSFTSKHPIPWQLDASQLRTERQQNKRAVIIGGGIAGSTTAQSLAKRGFDVTIVERNNTVAQEASGNPQGMLYAKLSANNSALARFYFFAFSYAQHYYKHWLDDSGDIGGDLCGLLQLAFSDKEEALQRELKERYENHSDFVRFLNQEEASREASIALQHAALYFPQAGWIDPAAYCRHCIKHSHIKLISNTKADQLRWNEHNESWSVLDEEHNTIAEAPFVIIANSVDAKQFEQTKHLPTKSIRGQITYLNKSDDVLNSTSTLAALKTVLCSDGYLTPQYKNQHCIGATYNLNENTPDCRAEDHLENLHAMHSVVPDLTEDLYKIKNLDGRVGFRCTSPDYLPIVGKVPIKEKFLRDYQLMAKNAKADIPIPGQYHTGLYLNIAHGSKGITSSPLCSELIAAQICHEPYPLEASLIESLAPARFIIRDVKRGKS